MSNRRRGKKPAKVSRAWTPRDKDVVPQCERWSDLADFETDEDTEFAAKFNALLREYEKDDGPDWKDAVDALWLTNCG